MFSFSFERLLTATKQGEQSERGVLNSAVQHSFECHPKAQFIRELREARKMNEPSGVAIRDNEPASIRMT